MPTFNKLISMLATVIALTGCATTYSNKELQEMFKAKGIDSQETERGVVVFLPDIFFAFDKADLTHPAKQSLTEIATIANDPGVLKRNLLVEGHTDSLGTDAYNLKLSERRAQAVYQDLIDNQVLPERISSRGFGEKYPIALDFNADGTPNPQGQAKNRRVEVVMKNIETKD